VLAALFPDNYPRGACLWLALARAVGQIGRCAGARNGGDPAARVPGGGGRGRHGPEPAAPARAPLARRLPPHSPVSLPAHPFRPFAGPG